MPRGTQPSLARSSWPGGVGVEVRVGLSTLLGRDRHPGEIPGWGPVPAEVARTVVAAQRAAEWRFALTDPAGQLLLAGITRRRPQHTAPEPTTSQPPPCRGGIVELQLPAALLTELTADLDACGQWAATVADIAAHYAKHIQSGRRGPDAQDPTARFAGAALRRHVEIRDRFCVHPGCRCSARGADLDHTLDHAYGGTTTEINSPRRRTPILEKPPPRPDPPPPPAPPDPDEPPPFRAWYAARAC
ncbi:MAG: HNH endonuclease signature motif containing protein [Pseudonocardiaceae bacterium]